MEFVGITIFGGVNITPPAPPRPMAPGDAYQGGFYAGQISTTGNGVATHNLVVGPKASAQSLKKWRTLQQGADIGASVIDGPTNSANMNNADYPAAQFCEGLTIGGYTDWYLPARRELEVCYYNLKPTTDGNNTSYGINANAVPSRGSNYTSGIPAQTAATNFQSGGTEAYNGGYWSSTGKAGTAGVYTCQFTGSPGFQGYINQIYQSYARAVRRVAI